MLFSLPFPDGETLIVLAISAFLGGLVRGFTGFGFAMVFVPVASLVIGPPAAVATLWFIDLPFALVLGARAAGKADIRQSLLLLTGASLTLPLGLHLLVTLDPVNARWLIAAVIFAAVLPLMAGWRYHGKAGPKLALGVGGVSGLCSGLAGLGGAPLALLWLSSAGKSLAAIRADMQFYFGISTFVSGTLLYWRGVLTLETLVISLAVAPLYGIGLALGAGGFHRASETLFRRIAYTIIIASAVLAAPALDGVLR